MKKQNLFLSFCLVGILIMLLLIGDILGLYYSLSVSLKGVDNRILIDALEKACEESVKVQLIKLIPLVLFTGVNLILFLLFKSKESTTKTSVYEKDNSSPFTGIEKLSSSVIIKEVEPTAPIKQSSFQNIKSTFSYFNFANYQGDNLTKGSNCTLKADGNDVKLYAQDSFIGLVDNSIANHYIHEYGKDFCLNALLDSYSIENNVLKTVVQIFFPSK